MAPNRAFSFPLSHAEEVSRQPPFQVDPSDASQLTSCEAFRCIRDLLQCQESNVFCESHNDVSNVEREAWLLQRDISFALIFPIIEIYRNATEIALSMLGNRNIFDLELVFRGEARGAFSWLQCFIAVENDWCAAEGCPACIVSYVLQSEPTIRLVITACRLASRVLDPREETHDIPILGFWTKSLYRALQEDRFWGQDSWMKLEDRAKSLEEGIFVMAQQCCELGRMSNSSKEDSALPESMIPSEMPQRLGTYSQINGKMTFVNDGDTWMQKIVLGCWTTLLVDAKQQRRVDSTEKKADDGPSRPLSASL